MKKKSRIFFQLATLFFKEVILFNNVLMTHHFSTNNSSPCINIFDYQAHCNLTDCQNQYEPLQTQKQFLALLHTMEEMTITKKFYWQPCGMCRKILTYPRDKNIILGKTTNSQCSSLISLGQKPSPTFIEPGDNQDYLQRCMSKLFKEHQVIQYFSVLCISQLHTQNCSYIH